jgi:hypothetical protein
MAWIAQRFEIRVIVAAPFGAVDDVVDRRREHDAAGT